MVKPALASTRAARVLDFLSNHPGQAHSLTEIARALRVNAPSTLSVLTALDELGYVLRHPIHKTYVLGPALVAVGHAALAQHPVLAVARSELDLVAEEIEAICAGNVRMGDEIVSVIDAGRPRSLTTALRIGTRTHYRPPYGAPFAAWAPADDTARWIAAGSLGDEARARRLADALAVVRETGIAVGGTSAASERMLELIWGDVGDPLDGRREQELEDIARQLTDTFLDDTLNGGDYAATTLTVPVFGPKHEVAMIITAFGFERPLGPDDAKRVGTRLRTSAHHITARAFGTTATRP
jgi:DNA-binding IclR family transcriptional regulator